MKITETAIIPEQKLTRYLLLVSNLKRRKNKMLEFYQQVSLNRDLPEHNLKKGDIATLIDTIPHPTHGEDGYVL